MPKAKKAKTKRVKKEVKKKKVKKEIKKPKVAEKPEKYYQAIGRRKTAIALVRLFTRRLQPSLPSVEGKPLESDFLVNGKPLNVYFPNSESQQTALASLKKMKAEDRFRVIARVKGGGPFAQAEAIRHAIARALVLFNPDYRKRLKRAGFLTRDPRMKERKKFGLKRARKAPQWAKR
jgi:small subunit ribosomal protein S9